MKITNKTVAIAIALFIAGMFFRSAFASGLDTDGDGVPDTSDNCSEVANADQRDTNGDGFGNICDPDLNNDLFVNFTDLNQMRAVFFTADADANLDGLSVVNFADLAIMSNFFFGPPGPGATSVPVTYTNDIQPILEAKCAPCHTGLGVGGHDIGTAYADSFNSASTCPGLNVAECSLTRIQDGSMPQGAGCTGDPGQDAGIAACLTQEEQDDIQAWLDAGLPQ